MNPDNFEAANLFYTKRPRMNEQIHWVHVDRRPNCVIAVLDFLKVLYFFSWFGCHFKGLFIPVLREIRRSKILPVTSSLTNRTASDISRHSICQSCEKSPPRHFVARSVAARPRALKLASLTFKNLCEVDLKQV